MIFDIDGGKKKRKKIETLSLHPSLLAVSRSSKLCFEINQYRYAFSKLSEAFIFFDCQVKRGSFRRFNVYCLIVSSSLGWNFKNACLSEMGA